MTSVIRDAITIYLQDRDKSFFGGSDKLWVSDVGDCPRKAIMRILGYQGEPFKPDSLEYMHDGVILEKATIDMLKYVYGGCNIKDQVGVYNHFWSGKIDCLVIPEDDRIAPVTKDTIIELKATGSKWWNYKLNLPKMPHVAQLVLYGQLYEEICGEKPDLVLYYRAWGHWAELTLHPEQMNIFAVGLMDGEHYEKVILVNVAELRGNLENYLRAVMTSKSLPLNLETDMGQQEAEDLLPPKLIDQNEGCTFKGKPSCPMYKHCWGYAYENEIPF